MAELQTISAAFELAKLAKGICVFLNKIRNADKIIRDASEKIEKASRVLDDVGEVLRSRQPPPDSESSVKQAQVIKRINDSVRECRDKLERIQACLGATEEHDRPNLTALLVDKVRVAFKQSSLSKLHNELEAHINILQTSLIIIQLLVFL